MSKFIFLDQYEDPMDNPFLYLWIVASIISSCYAYTWDIKMDWGLFDKAAGENKFLREEIVYSSTVSWEHYINLLYFYVMFLSVLLLFCHCNGFSTSFRMGAVILFNGQPVCEW